MSRTARYANVGAVIVPFVGFIAALILLWNDLVGWSDLAILAFTYVVTGLGVTIGYHRLLTCPHRGGVKSAVNAPRRSSFRRSRG